MNNNPGGIQGNLKDEIRVPGSAIQYISGETLQKLQSQTACHIQISPSGPDVNAERAITLSGMPLSLSLPSAISTSFPSLLSLSFFLLSLCLPHLLSLFTSHLCLLYISISVSHTAEAVTNAEYKSRL